MRYMDKLNMKKIFRDMYNRNRKTFKLRTGKEKMIKEKEIVPYSQKERAKGKKG